MLLNSLIPQINFHELFHTSISFPRLVAFPIWEQHNRKTLLFDILNRIVRFQVHIFCKTLNQAHAEQAMSKYKLTSKTSKSWIEDAESVGILNEPARDAD